MLSNELNKSLESTFSRLDDGIKDFDFAFAPREVGYVTGVATGIVKVSGLPGAGFEELLKFPGNLFGIAFNIDKD